MTVSGTIIPLAVPADRIAYNPALIKTGSERVLAVRVESPDSHWLDRSKWNPEVWFYQEVAEGQWERVMDAPVFTAAEDPFVAWVTGADGRPELIFGHVTLDRATPTPTIVTRFYRAPSWRELDQSQSFAEVRDMKDIRLCELADGRIAVCGRPKGGSAGRGQVTFRVLDSLADLSHEAVWAAPVLPDMVSADYKIGSNQLTLLPDGQVGVLGHTALGNEEDIMRYIVATWIIDPATGVSTKPRQIAERGEFPLAPSKFPRLDDVVFPGSLEHLEGDTWRLYSGLSDAAVGSIDVTAPF